MFDVITKDEYFRSLNLGHADPQNHSLKAIQDGWTISQLIGTKGKKVLEVGGGNSRVLPLLKGNELWNVDRFEGQGQGPTEIVDQDSVHIIDAFLGDFDRRLPEVDIIFSISVIEHVPAEQLDNVFLDMARILKTGGRMYHTIDIPFSDDPIPIADKRIEYLKRAVEKADLVWHQEPVVTGGMTFKSNMASNSDLMHWSWTKICDNTKVSAPINQLVSLKLIAEKQEQFH